ncbi:MAG: DNA adenine methylase [Akkermansiaceae bacterium]|nr:DNA adenine methylase [Akkermansiaceae bacterium]
MGRSSTTYPRKWNSGKTTVIRVPEKIADALLDVAHRLDAFGSFRVREEAEGLFLETSPPRRVHYDARKPVNVASVPQRSPFRYPGGKTWFVPYLRDWLLSKPELPDRFIEPFAGGGIMSLTVAFEKLAKDVIFSELDADIAAVWKVMLSEHAEWLAKEILRFDLSMNNVRKILDSSSKAVQKRAFQTIIRNRVQRGGIMAPGAGLVKAGENGRGLKSRWYPETLARRIREIYHLRNRLTFIEGDAFDLLHRLKNDKNAVFFIDPPYTIAAKRLYTKWEIDHRQLFEGLQKCKGDFLMTYDNTPEISALAAEFNFESRPVAMKSTHHAKMTELLIGRDFQWLDNNGTI